MARLTSLTRGIQQATLRWLERVFYGGAELAALSSPAFVLVLVSQGRYPDAAPIAGLLALAFGSLSLALFRSRRVDVGAWPRRGELRSLPLRAIYFSALFATACLGVAEAAISVGSLWVALLGGVVQTTGLAAFPLTYRTIYGEPLQHPGVRP